MSLRRHINGDDKEVGSQKVTMGVVVMYLKGQHVCVDFQNHMQH